MKISLTNLALLLLFSCHAQPPASVDIPAIPHAYKLSSQIEKELIEKEESWKNQMAAWDYSFIGAHQKMLEAWDAQAQNRTPLGDSEWKEFQEKYKAVSAKEYILKQTINEKLVIINEAHHQPLHRVFTTELLQGLYDQGYRYLGCETLDKVDSELNERKYPIMITGGYSDEPQFGNMIRKALEIGFELFPYEGGKSGSDREITQAKNIKAVMDKHPDGKFLIHCGFSHAVEGDYEAWGKAMAGRLFEFTDVNPLTINQEIYSEKSKTSFCDPLYQRLSLNESSVFVDKEAHSFKYPAHPDWFDIMVFHPATKYVNDRPAWLLRNGKTFVKLDLTTVGIELPYWIFAMKKNENFRLAVPCDIQERKTKDDQVTLVLESGEYVLRIQNAKRKAQSMDLVVD